MRFLVNRKGLAQCHSCKSWRELKPDALCSNYHSYQCCGRKFLIAVTDEGLRAIKSGGNIDKPEPSWWVTDKKGVG